MKRSSVPSTPNRGPAGSSSPSRDAAADSAVLIGAGSRTHSDMPPTPGPGSQSGRCRSQQRQQERPSCPQDLPALGQQLVALREKPCGGELFEDRRCPCRSTAAARRWWRWWRARRGSSRSAARPRTISTSSRRSAPGRVASSSRRPSARGTGSSSHMSSDRLVDDRAGPGLGDDVRQPFSVVRGHGQPGGVVVVGDQVGQARATVAGRRRAMASSSQPSSVIATGTGRAPAVVIADSAP